ncbi:hypothetical protein A6R68_20921, partial [Neotoma lepida]
AEYFYEFLSLRSLDKGIMADPTVNVPLLGTVPHKASVVQVGFPCLGKQDGVAAFEVNVIVMNSEGNTILQTPQNAIFFKTCQQAECPGGCRNGGFCNERRVCECPDGFYGPHCEKANCSTTCFNGGTCFYPGKCICPPGLEGEQCEMSKCPQPCRNGGKCIGKSKCKCPKGYQGDLCSKRKYHPRERYGCGRSASLAAVLTEPATNPTNANVEKAGMEDTAIRGTEPASCMPRGQQAPGRSSARLHLKRPRRGGIHLNPITSGELQQLKRFKLHQ